MLTVNEVLSNPTQWDAIIVGTGMGGAACGYGLTKLGKKVLFLECGSSTQRLGTVPQAVPDGEQPRLARGWWPTKIETEIDGVLDRKYYPLGCGVGGSTLMYGAALERLDPKDFEPARHHDDKGESALPQTWPFSYDDLEPYYHRAEKILNVCGENDPLQVGILKTLNEAPALSDRDRALIADFQKAGLHPYRLPVSIRYLDKCAECIGYACARGCKLDAQNAFVDPALAAGAILLERCEVIHINDDGKRATGVRCRVSGQEVNIAAKNVVLSAGALASPKILLSSTSAKWPNGLANNTGLVGRFLMFHIGNQFAVWSRGSYTDEAPRKTIALKDFYALDGVKYGAVQTVGVPAGRGNIHLYLKQLVGENFVKKIPFLSKVLGVVALIAEKIFGKATVFTAMLEDLPYKDNRVVLSATSPSGYKVIYNIRDELDARAKVFRSIVTKAMRYNRTMLIDRTIRLNYGHPVGSIRAGDDPSTSVLRYDNRAHEVENLYIVDGSFFPSSGGVNPSLTIAANALRVADLMAGQAPGGAFDEAAHLLDLPTSDCAQTTERTRLSDRIVVITGAGSGLGRALCLGFARDGATVVAIGRNLERLEKLKNETPTSRIDTMIGDVSCADEASRLVAEIERRYGRLDILINNAAVYEKEVFADIDWDNWWTAMATNVLGPAALSVASLPLMQNNGFGRILMVGSFADRAPLPASSSYAVSKGALHTLTKALAEEVNRGKFPDIAINEFIPAPMKTGMGSSDGIFPEDCYPWVRTIVTQPAHGAHGAVFFKDMEIKPAKSLKRRILEKLTFTKQS